MSTQFFIRGVYAQFFVDVVDALPCVQHLSLHYDGKRGSSD